MNIMHLKILIYLLKKETKGRPVRFMGFADMPDQDLSRYGLIGSPTAVERMFAPPEAEKQQSLWGMDLGDLLLLCILFLILLESQDEDPLPLLITAAAFFLLR